MEMNEKRRTDAGRIMGPVEMLNRMACCCTAQRLMVSQVAVLTAVARFPAVSCGTVVQLTGMSDPNVGRILNYLVDVGDITFVRRKPTEAREYPCVKRLFFITPQGARTIRMMMKHMVWTDGSKFGIVELNNEPGEKEGNGDVCGET